ncbi:UBIQUITIN_CONJUGAT_2 domain-containing protein [Meloidogyne graminicola]|uniref:UBIQUITIN_CONJUGAT_2 domain-containing protein n=1 Tax=Meloidogyne graminicola TaxID=189291 RepID=A0A8T0A1G7_9BILA|nr:UBIQUITIN_CONJUGAT_2 domain-containing protein [Meloidogyne graminicola]
MVGGGATITAVTRLKKDYQKLVRDPVPFAIAAPLPSNILEWHYVVIGAPETPYEGDMLTPSGRFQVNTRLCLSISDFHPDTWNPSWSVSTIIMGLISFMNENSPTLGSLITSDFEKRILARRSREFNIKNAQFCEIFSELANQIRCELEGEKAVLGGRTRGTETENRQTTRPTSSSFTGNLLLVTGVIILFFAVRYVVLNSTSI